MLPRYNKTRGIYLVQKGIETVEKAAWSNVEVPVLPFQCQNAFYFTNRNKPFSYFDILYVSTYPWRVWRWWWGSRSSVARVDESTNFIVVRLDGHLSDEAIAVVIVRGRYRR